MTLSRTPDGIAAALQELQERHVHTVPYDELWSFWKKSKVFVKSINPKEELSPRQMGEIDRVYVDYPHLNDDEFVKRHLHKWLG